MTEPIPVRPRILFLGTGNAHRSQMAEAWLRHLTAGRLEVASAGTDPSGVDARATAVMGEVGIDLASHVAEPLEAHAGEPPSLVITVSSEASRAARLPEGTAVLAWSFDDPAASSEASGESDDAELASFRRVRDGIRERITDWLAEGLPALG